MTDPTELSEADERFVAELNRLASTRDPVPAELIQIAKQTFTWRSVDEELAELIADSFSGDELSTLVRSSSMTVRLLSFATAHLTLELQILPSGARRRLVGEVSPSCRARVDVLQRDATTSKETDELGRFLTEDLPAGRVRVRIRPLGSDAGPALITDWIEL